MRYLALLRGINVGGKNKVEMKKLKTTFELLGFTNVVTYINSGNIIFEELNKQQGVITNEIETSIKQNFNLNIKVVLKNREDIETINRALPPTWIKSEIMRTDIMFLWDEVDKPEIMEEIQINSVDSVKYVSGALLWKIEDVDYNKSGMLNLMGTKLYKNITVRNENTFRKLHEIMIK